MRQGDNSNTPFRAQPQLQLKSAQRPNGNSNGVREAQGRRVASHAVKQQGQGLYRKNVKRDSRVPRRELVHTDRACLVHIASDPRRHHRLQQYLSVERGKQRETSLFYLKVTPYVGVFLKKYLVRLNASCPRLPCERRHAPGEIRTRHKNQFGSAAEASATQEHRTCERTSYRVRYLPYDYSISTKECD